MQIEKLHAARQLPAWLIFDVGQKMTRLNLMSFDARSEHTPEQKAAFVEWLIAETTQLFAKSAGDAEGLKSCVFLAVNRAHDAGLTSKESAQIIGVSSARACLSTSDESIAFDWLEVLDPIATAVHDGSEKAKPWWRFWKS